MSDPIERAAKREPIGNVAYAAVIAKDGGFTLGIAKRDEPGYYLTNYDRVPTMEDAQRWADSANERMGLTKQEAIEIITSTMYAQNRDEAHR